MATLESQTPVEVAQFVYPYPYYADEWYAVAFMKDSLKEGRLPLYYPFGKKDIPFVNLETAFHALLSEITLVLHSNPLKLYPFLGFVINTLIIVSLYNFLRLNGVRHLAATLASLGSLYITTGANLPGLWYLLPINVGLLVMLLFFTFLSAKRVTLTVLAALAALVFYPPLAVFILPACIAFLLTNRGDAIENTVKTFIKVIIATTIAAALVSLFYLASGGTLANYWTYIVNGKLLYSSFTQNAYPQYNVQDIIPIWTILLALLGTITVFRKRVLLATPAIVGFLLWFFYSANTFRVIIDFERAIFATGLLVVLLAGFGLDAIQAFLLKQKVLKQEYLHYLTLGVLIIFLIASFSYTASNNWKKLVLYEPLQDQYRLPSPPVNQYLTESDIAVFSHITHKRFLSHPWKGTVVGVATDNYPIAIKPGTISEGIQVYTDFVTSGCNFQKELAIKRKIHYVYLPHLNCEAFEKIGESKEGWKLYQFKAAQ